MSDVRLGTVALRHSLPQIEKLRCMRENAHMQRTLICTWLTELFLDKLNRHMCFMAYNVMHAFGVGPIVVPPAPILPLNLQPDANTSSS